VSLSDAEIEELTKLVRRAQSPCGAYLGDNDATTPQLTCIRRAGHEGLHDNVVGDSGDKIVDAVPRLLSALAECRRERDEAREQLRKLDGLPASDKKELADFAAFLGMPEANMKSMESLRADLAEARGLLEALHGELSKDSHARRWPVLMAGMKSFLARTAASAPKDPADAARQEKDA